MRAMILAVAVLCAFPVSAAQTFGSLEYRDPTGDESIQIGRTLVKRNVRGCGEYYVNVRDGGRAPEYAIKCTRDGETWRYWLVWTEIQKVSGPFDAGHQIP